MLVDLDCWSSAVNLTDLHLHSSPCVVALRPSAGAGFYRAIELPMGSDEEAAALPPEVKQEYAEVILQAILAESLGAFQSEKLNSDTRVRLMWNWHNVDDAGRDEIADEQLASWERITEIVAMAINRRPETGEQPTTVVTATLGFERSKAVRGDLAAVHMFPLGNAE